MDDLDSHIAATTEAPQQKCRYCTAVADVTIHADAHERPRDELYCGAYDKWVERVSEAEKTKIAENTAALVANRYIPHTYAPVDVSLTRQYLCFKGHNEWRLYYMRLARIISHTNAQDDTSLALDIMKTLLANLGIPAFLNTFDIDVTSTNLYVRSPLFLYMCLHNIPRDPDALTQLKSGLLGLLVECVLCHDMHNDKSTTLYVGSEQRHRRHNVFVVTKKDTLFPHAMRHGLSRGLLLTALTDTAIVQMSKQQCLFYMRLVRQMCIDTRYPVELFELCLLWCSLLMRVYAPKANTTPTLTDNALACLAHFDMLYVTNILTWQTALDICTVHSCGYKSVVFTDDDVRPEEPQFPEFPTLDMSGFPFMLWYSETDLSADRTAVDVRAHKMTPNLNYFNVSKFLCIDAIDRATFITKGFCLPSYPVQYKQCMARMAVWPNYMNKYRRLADITTTSGLKGNASAAFIQFCVKEAVKIKVPWLLSITETSSEAVVCETVTLDTLFDMYDAYRRWQGPTDEAFIKHLTKTLVIPTVAGAYDTANEQMINLNVCFGMLRCRRLLNGLANLPERNDGPTTHPTEGGVLVYCLWIFYVVLPKLLKPRLLWQQNSFVVHSLPQALATEAEAVSKLSTVAFHDVPRDTTRVALCTKLARATPTLGNVRALVSVTRKLFANYTAWLTPLQQKAIFCSLIDTFTFNFPLYCATETRSWQDFIDLPTTYLSGLYDNESLAEFELGTKDVIQPLEYEHIGMLTDKDFVSLPTAGLVRCYAAVDKQRDLNRFVLSERDNKTFDDTRNYIKAALYRHMDLAQKAHLKLQVDLNAAQTQVDVENIVTNLPQDTLKKLKLRASDKSTTATTQPTTSTQSKGPNVTTTQNASTVAGGDGTHASPIHVRSSPRSHYVESPHYLAGFTARQRISSVFSFAPGNVVDVSDMPRIDGSKTITKRVTRVNAGYKKKTISLHHATVVPPADQSASVLLAPDYDTTTGEKMPDYRKQYRFLVYANKDPNTFLTETNDILQRECEMLDNFYVDTHYTRHTSGPKATKAVLNILRTYSVYNGEDSQFIFDFTPVADDYKNAMGYMTMLTMYQLPVVMVIPWVDKIHIYYNKDTLRNTPMMLTFNPNGFFEVGRPMGLQKELLIETLGTGNTKALVVDLCKAAHYDVVDTCKDGNCGLNCFTMKNSALTIEYLRTQLTKYVKSGELTGPEGISKATYATEIGKASYFLHWEEMHFLAVKLGYKLVILTMLTESIPAYTADSLFVAFYNSHYDYVRPQANRSAPIANDSQQLYIPTHDSLSNTA